MYLPLSLRRVFDGPQKNVEGVRAGASGKKAELSVREVALIKKRMYQPAVNNSGEQLQMDLQERDGPAVFRREGALLWDGEDIPQVEDIGSEPPLKYHVEDGAKKLQVFIWD